MWRDRLCAKARLPLHAVEYHRRWFRELAAFYRHLSREEFWLRYDRARQQAAGLADMNPATLWTHTDYFILRQMYYHRDRCWHEASRYLPRGSEWLEYGCGVAPASAWLMRHRPDATGFAVDITSRTLDFARWRFKDSGRVSVEALPLPLTAGGFGLIVCSEVLEHVPDPFAVAVTLAKALAPGGTLLVNFVEAEPSGANLASAQRGRAETLRYLFEELEVVRSITAHGPDGIYRRTS